MPAADVPGLRPVRRTLAESASGECALRFERDGGFGEIAEVPLVFSAQTAPSAAFALEPFPDGSIGRELER